MTSPTCDEELLSSIASLSQPRSLKSGTLEHPHNSVPKSLEIISTPEHTSIDIQTSSSTHVSTVNTQPISSTLKNSQSPTPPPTTLQVTINNTTCTVPSKKKYNILENPVFIDSGFLPPVLHPIKNLPKLTL